MKDENGEGYVRLFLCCDYRLEDVSIVENFRNDGKKRSKWVPYSSVRKQVSKKTIRRDANAGLKVEATQKSAAVCSYLPYVSRRIGHAESE